MTEVVLPKDDDNIESSTPEEKLENEGIKPAPPQRKLEMVDYGAHRSLQKGCAKRNM